MANATKEGTKAGIQKNKGVPAIFRKTEVFSSLSISSSDGMLIDGRKRENGKIRGRKWNNLLELAPCF